MRRALLAACLVAGCAGAPASAPKPPGVDPGATTPVVIGETFRLPSKILGEERVINVYLPPGYGEGDARFPVLYMPDGGIQEDFPHITGAVDVSIKNAVIRPILVVGIANTVRRRDLAMKSELPEEMEMAPLAGGADKFRAFLRDELKPEIARRYRATAESAIIGESLAGLFVVETLFAEPALFDAYIAADPSIWWNRQSVVRGADARLAAWQQPPKKLFVATADTKEMVEGTAILNDTMARHAAAGIEYRYVPMPEEQHGTIFPFAALRGIRWVFRSPPAAK